MRSITYKKAGVDIEAGDEAVKKIKLLAKKTFRDEVIGEIGSFSSLFSIPPGYKNPVLVSSTDGVGTKLKIAFMSKKHNTIGIDLVAMCVNDILIHGAEPLFFLDYIATGKLKPEIIKEIVSGIAEGCIIANCSLIGGETAEMPGFYHADEYDVAGFVVGIVEKEKIIDGRNISDNDKIIGLASNGLHSNGYSLVRKIIFDQLKMNLRDNLSGMKESLEDILLKPTKIYVKNILRILKEFNIKGMAHITGGGITLNLPRIIPEYHFAAIKINSWAIPPIFRLLQEKGNIPDEEMYRTFNMGIGLILIVDSKDCIPVCKKLGKMQEGAFIIGEIKKGHEGVLYE